VKLKLTRPIVFFDLETTGIDVVNDRIVELCMVKISPDGSRLTGTRRFNPLMPIPPEASAVHGITNDDVKDCPTFADRATQVAQFIADCDLAGYNSNRFDIPLLVEELARCGVHIATDNVKMIDVQTIFYKKEPRTLVAAVQKYCGRELEDAHAAEADVLATIDVLEAQLELYDDLPNTVEELSEFSKMNNNVDLAGKVIINDDGDTVFTFGKYVGQNVKKTFKADPSYYNWILKSNFTANTKSVLTNIYKTK